MLLAQHPQGVSGTIHAKSGPEHPTNFTELLSFLGFW